MDIVSSFKESLNAAEPPAGLSIQLNALWYDEKGDWHKAHALVDQLNDQSSALVHAYLHRKEGDIWNADYWYRKAKSSRPATSLVLEWEHLVNHFIELNRNQ
ncbi:hypothetical protein [Pedobacter sp. Leaf170]|uniref:hypothetical protein n=1 Tax=Pedobacter sp. Leaf170 TaxID=2876558 RepID=UPI001E5F9EFC|nr:hypothetical protein [Pedobacter sp. Leaf170]